MKKLLEQKRVEKKIGFDNYTQKDVGNKKCNREPYINYFRNKFRENRKKAKCILCKDVLLEVTLNTVSILP